MDPLPSQQPEESRPSPGAWGAPEPSPEPRKSPSRAGLAAAACLAVGMIALAVTKLPRGAAVPPAVGSAGALDPAATQELVSAMPVAGRVEAMSDACYREGPSLDPALPAGDYSGLPESWRTAPSGDLYRSRPRAFGEAKGLYPDDLPPPGRECRLPTGPR